MLGKCHLFCYEDHMKKQKYIKLIVGRWITSSIISRIDSRLANIASIPSNGGSIHKSKHKREFYFFFSSYFCFFSLSLYLSLSLCFLNISFHFKCNTFCDYSFSISVICVVTLFHIFSSRISFVFFCIFLKIRFLFNHRNKFFH